jgi:hypothetical protein
MGAHGVAEILEFASSQLLEFAVEQTGMARGRLLEQVIVLILILELALFFAGVMR